MRILKIMLVCLVCTFTAHGQAGDLQGLVAEGIKLHDAGDFNGAIEKYKKALEIDSKSPLVNYEIASTYFSIQNYDKALGHCEIVLAGKSDYLDQAYILKGSALDLLERPAEAVKVYREGIRNYPSSHLLYYNLALTSYNMKEYAEVEKALQQSLSLKPGHASSHLLLGFMMNQQGNRVKSLLALYNFLLLEPTGERATTALNLLDAELRKGVSKESEKNTTITMSMPDKSDEFRPAEMMLSMMEATKGTESDKGKSEAELFAENTKTLFSFLGEIRKKNKGFWWDFYVDFFKNMASENQVEAFSYYITQSRKDEAINAWIEQHPEKIDLLSKWYEEVQRGGEKK